MKKILSVFMVIAISMCFVACGNSETESGNENTGTGNNGNTVQSTDVDVNKNNGGFEGVQNNSGKITLQDVLNAHPSPESDFEVIDYGEGIVELVGYSGDDEIVVIPETVNGKAITEIAAYLFSDDAHPEVKAIRLSDSIKTVSTGAFGLNNSLEIFVAGAGLEEIGVSAFQLCSNLTTVKLNEGLKILDSMSICECYNLKEIEIPSTVTTIDAMAFYSPAEGFTITGVAGSAAETYANEQQINFIAK